MTLILVLGGIAVGFILGMMIARLVKKDAPDSHQIATVEIEKDIAERLYKFQVGSVFLLKHGTSIEEQPLDEMVNDILRAFVDRKVKVPMPPNFR